MVEKKSGWWGARAEANGCQPYAHGNKTVKTEDEILYLIVTLHSSRLGIVSCHALLPRHIQELLPQFERDDWDKSCFAAEKAQDEPCSYVSVSVGVSERVCSTSTHSVTLTEQPAVEPHLLDPTRAT